MPRHGSSSDRVLPRINGFRRRNPKRDIAWWRQRHAGLHYRWNCPGVLRRASDHRRTGYVDPRRGSKRRHRSFHVELLHWRGQPPNARVTLMSARGSKLLTVTKLLLKLAQNEQKRSESRKLKFALSCGWQRDLVEFSTRQRNGNFIFSRPPGFNRSFLIIAADGRFLRSLCPSIFSHQRMT